jgi:hypothetical protein
VIRPVGASKLPRALTGSRVRKLLDEAEKHFRSVPRPKPGSFRFDDSVFDSDEVKGALAVLFGGKCAYCESVFDERRQLEVDHFRPLYNSLGLDGAPSPDHYWWLAYDWENLLPSCVECAQRKGARDSRSAAPGRARRPEARHCRRSGRCCSIRAGMRLKAI